MAKVIYTTPRGAKIVVEHITTEKRVVTNDVTVDKTVNKITVSLNGENLRDPKRSNVKTVGDAYIGYSDSYSQSVTVPIPADKKTEIDALHAAKKEIFDTEMNREREWDENRRMVEDAVRTGE